MIDANRFTNPNYLNFHSKTKKAGSLSSLLFSKDSYAIQSKTASGHCAVEAACYNF
ncbi:hypothetical protein D2M30_1304 [Bacillus amyloliquefaciens]|nr:hypothetical protein D2M30_1304 [Bacillus amyloliquefaciens]